MWQLHSSRLLENVFFITLEIRYLLVHYKNMIQLLCVLGPHFWITFVWYVCITYWNNVTATFRFCLSLWHTFIISQLHYIFVERVAFSPDVRIKLNYWNCRNVWTVYGSYVLKWLYFSYIIFLAHLLFDNLKITLIVVYLH